MRSIGFESRLSRVVEILLFGGLQAESCQKLFGSPLSGTPTRFCFWIGGVAVPVWRGKFK
jgi:hypothetical protein